LALISPAFAQQEKSHEKDHKKEIKTKHEAKSDSGHHEKVKVKEKGHRPDHMQVGIEDDVQKLNLSDEQKNRIAAINQDFRTRRAALKDQNISKEDMRIGWETLQKEHVAAIHAVLNEDQRKQLSAMGKGKRKVKQGDYKYKEKKEVDNK
jgi:hypothetical protein